MQTAHLIKIVNRARRCADDTQAYKLTHSNRVINTLYLARPTANWVSQSSDISISLSSIIHMKLMFQSVTAKETMKL